MALPYIAVLAWGTCRLLAGPLRRSEFLWLALVLSAASATKPSVMPIMLGGLVVASGACLLWDRSRLRAVSGLTGIGLVLQFAVLTFAHGGGNVTVSRLVADLRPFSELAERSIERAANDGLLLETLDSPRMLLIAGVTFGLFIGSHALWIGGVGALTAPSQRRSPGLWFLAALVLTALFFTSVIDHVAGAQFYFWHTASPVGVALTVAGFARLADKAGDRWSTAKVLLAGLAGGVVLSLMVTHLVRVRQRYSTSGALDRALLPAFVLLLLAAVIVLAWRRYRGRYGLVGLGGAATLAIIVGLALPAAVETNVVNISRSVQSVEYPDPSTSGNYLLAEEAQALYWLADNSEADDVIVSNAWCRPLTRAPKEPPCANQGFWVAGLTGRRTVIDGYAYTTDALEAHMTDGLTFRNVPLFDERVDAVISLISDASPTALADLQHDHDLKWIVVMTRSGLMAADLSGVAELVFDNDSALVYRVGQPGD